MNLSAYMPYVTENEKGVRVTKDLLSRLNDDFIILINGEVTQELVTVVQSQLLYMSATDSNKEIQIYIDSPGGICSGISIYDICKYINNPITTVVTGHAMSMGSLFLACCGNKGKRKALPHARIMLHQPSGGTGHATAAEMEILTNEIKNTKQILGGLYLKHCSGINEDNLKEIFSQDSYFSAEEALKLGIIDEIIQLKDK